MFDPTDKLSVTLEAQQWNQVIALVSEGAYRVAAPLIQTIGEQLRAHERPDNVIPMEVS